MQDKELIAKLKELINIRPRQEWVVLAKAKLFEEETKIQPAPLAGKRASIILDIFPRFIHHLNYRYVLATFTFIFLLVASVFIYARNALPGEALFSVKKAEEKVRTLLAPKNQFAQYQLEITNERLSELAKIVETKQGQKLAPAIKEFQASAKQAALNIKKAKKLNKEIVLEAKKLEQGKEKVQALGVVLGETDEFAMALAERVEMEIKDLETRTLTEKQKTQLEEAKKDLAAKNYSLALEKILALTQD